MDEKEYIESRVEDQRRWYSKKSTWNKRWHHGLRFAEITVAAFIPLLAAYTNAWPPFKVIVGALGLIAAICAGALGLFRFQENWTDYRTVAESLKHEKHLFLTQTTPYNGPDPFHLFVQNVESLISKENTAWRGRLSGEEGKQQA